MAEITWSSIADTVGKFAPMMGTLLGGPAGAAVGGMIASALGTSSTPDAVADALRANPEAALKLRQIESDERMKLRALSVEMAKAEMDAAVKSAADVNKSMQSEAASEHWPTYAWRPFIGFVFGFNLFVTSMTVSAVYIAVMCGNVSAAAALGSLPAMVGALGAVNGAALPVIGVASWFRGKMQNDPAIPTNNRG